MARHPFGWSLPPGCTQRHIDEAFGEDEPCECCGHDPADCICPVCPQCGEQGNKKCYEWPGHVLNYNKAQRIGQAKMRVAMLREKLRDEELFIEYMEQQEGESED